MSKRNFANSFQPSILKLRSSVDVYVTNIKEVNNLYLSLIELSPVGFEELESHSKLILHQNILVMTCLLSIVFTGNTIIS